MNQHGFIYPVTLCILLLTSVFLTIHFSQYVTEKGMITEINQQERRQYLILLTSKKIAEQISKGNIQGNGVYYYEGIYISYSLLQVSSLEYEVTFKLKHGSKQVSAVARYEKGSGKLTKWLYSV